MTNVYNIVRILNKKKKLSYRNFLEQQSVFHPNSVPFLDPNIWKNVTAKTLIGQPSRPYT